MEFLYMFVCDLLEDLYDIATSRTLPAKQKKTEIRDIIEKWGRTHEESIRKADAVALLSALLPELRTDKVYFIREPRLEEIVAKSEGLDKTHSDRKLFLSLWRKAGKGDLGDCVERVFRETDASRRRRKKVTVEEIEEATLTVASYERFSSPSVRNFSRPISSSSSQKHQPLVNLYQRVQSREAKWLTRLILKRHFPDDVVIPVYKIYRAVHRLLPDAIKYKSDFSNAIKLIKQYEESGDFNFRPHLRPETGVKVGRPPFFQGRSISHCVKMAGGRVMIVERKYDGEYLQLHIDLTKPSSQWIKIYSKSGKDSTGDRIKVHDTIRRCLRLGESSCKISRNCILEGELLVYSDKDNAILPFHKLRKHVNRSGSFLGTGGDSQAHDYEHLCIMFFDIMLLDDNPLLELKHSARQTHLESVLQIIPGRAGIVERTIIDFSSSHATKNLEEVFDRSVELKQEGLVVKPDEPYFSLSSEYEYGGFKSCCIKMKKDAMGDFEIGDFAAVGANYYEKSLKSFFPEEVCWTDFFLGCLVNKKEVVDSAAKPVFQIVATIGLNRKWMESLVYNASRGEAFLLKDGPEELPFELKVPKGIENGLLPETIFAKPFVFDVKSFGFDKEGNVGFESVRFSQVTKIHYDRDFLDCLTFEELQEKAREAREIPPELKDTEEEREREEELERKKERERGEECEWQEERKQEEEQEREEERDQEDERDQEEERERIRNSQKADPEESKIHRTELPKMEGTTASRDATQLNSTQGTTQLTTQRTSQETTDSNVSRERRESRASPRYITGQVTPQVAVITDSRSNISSTRAPPLGVRTMDVTSLQKSTPSQSSVQPQRSVSERQSPSPRIPVQECRAAKGSQPLWPPAQFLERADLARAAAEQVHGEADSEILKKSTVASTQTLSRTLSAPECSTSCARKREMGGQSPEPPAKRRRRTISSSSSASVRRRLAGGPISPPPIRRALTNITNDSISNRLPDRRESLAERTALIVARPLGSEPLPTPPEQSSDLKIYEDPVIQVARDEDSENTLVVGPLTPRSTVGKLRSIHSSKSVIQHRLGTPPNSSPSAIVRGKTHLPTLFLPSHPECRFSTAQHPCEFARYTFFLSPCISNNALIVNTLLRPHNRSFTTSLTQWADTSLFPTYFPATHAQFPGKRMLRCVLVEMNNAQATRDLITEIQNWVEKTELRRSNGDREPIVVVDWRILEKVRKMEGSERGREVEYSIWRRFSSWNQFL